MTAPVNYLEQLAILQIDFDIWSGQVKLDDPDFKLGVGGELPPKELVDLGRKYVINKEHLRPFNRLKTQARRLCLAYGMPFMNGFAVPLDKVDTISKDLDLIAMKMDDLKFNFLINYDKWIGEWEQKNADYAVAIRTGVLPKAVVQKRIDFNYQVFQVNPVNEAQANKLNTMAAGLSDELMDEIVLEANNFFHSSIKGKEKTCQSNTQKTLKRLREKVDGLSFLDGRFRSVVELLDKTIASYGGAGKTISEEQYYRVLSATLILSSKEKIKEYALGELDYELMANSYMFGKHDESVIPVFPNPSPEQEQIDEQDTGIDAFLPDEDDIENFFRKHIGDGASSFF